MHSEILGRCNVKTKLCNTVLIGKYYKKTKTNLELKPQGIYKSGAGELMSSASSGKYVSSVKLFSLLSSVL